MTGTAALRPRWALLVAIGAALLGPLSSVHAQEGAAGATASDSLVAKLPAMPPGEPPKTGSREARRLNAQGLDAHRAADWDTAIARYIDALAADPSHLLARYNLACALARRGDRDAALDVLAQLRAADCARCWRQLGHAVRDPDFESLYADPRFAALTGASVNRAPPTPAPKVATAKAPEPAWGVPARIGSPPTIVGPEGPRVAPMVRFRRWKRALPDFCTRRDMQVMETDPEERADWVFAWSFEGTGDEPDCPHPTVGLVANPRGALETTAYCVDGISVWDADGDGRSDLVIGHVGCAGPAEGNELELCLDRPIQPWCVTVARDVVSERFVTVGGKPVLEVCVSSDPGAYEDESLLSWHRISWDGAQLVTVPYKTEPDDADE